MKTEKEWNEISAWARGYHCSSDACRDPRCVTVRRLVEIAKAEASANARDFQFAPLQAPAWLRVLLERRWATPHEVPQEYVSRGFPSWGVSPYDGCGIARVVYTEPLPSNWRQIVLEAQGERQAQEQQAMQRFLESIGIPPAPQVPETAH